MSINELNPHKSHMRRGYEPHMRRGYEPHFLGEEPEAQGSNLPMGTRLITRRPGFGHLNWR